MGTTLTNGIYLPNEGEKNCYAGLKINWETLDQKIADIAALQQAVAGALHREIVASLPTTDIDPNTIYMILSGTSATENVYNEFMYVNNAWELIGTSATDLTNYYTKGDVDGLLLLKANASDLTSHTGDTTIHVTASDKTKWTNSANTHVLRLALSALTPSTSDNSFSNLDDSTALKVGDKVMDTAGVLFEVTAIDTANSTFTIGTALIDLATDADVVHKTGDETVAGVKTFSNNPIVGNNNTNITISNRQITANGSYSAPTGSSYSFMQLKAITNYADSSPSIDATVVLSSQENAYSDGKRAGFNPNSNNTINLGLSGKRWANVYATNYYYGGSEIEFSTKFVTTDTNQTITATKTFDGVDINFKSNNAEYSVTSGYKDIFFLDKNSTRLAYFRQGVYSSGLSYQTFNILGYDSNNQQVSQSITFGSGNLGLSTAFLKPDTDNAIALGRSGAKWSDVQTYKVNNLEPSSLSLPSGNVSDVIDISSYLTNLDGTQNTYTASVNGWISITMSNCTGVQAYINGLWGHNVIRQSGGIVRFLMPITKNLTANILIYGGTIDNARFIPCQGNV